MDYRQGTDGFFFILYDVCFLFSWHRNHVEAVRMDFRYGPLWSETHRQPLWKNDVTGRQARLFGRKRFDFIKLLRILSSFSDLLEGSRSPHQLVDHVDGDPHEGWKANDVSNRDAPVWVLVVKQCKLRRLEQGAHYDILKRVGAHEEFVKYWHNVSRDQTLHRGCKWYKEECKKKTG